MGFPKHMHRLLDGKPDRVKVNNEAEEKSARVKGFVDDEPKPADHIEDAPKA